MYPNPGLNVAWRSNISRRNVQEVCRNQMWLFRRDVVSCSVEYAHKTIHLYIQLIAGLQYIWNIFHLLQ